MKFGVSTRSIMQLGAAILVNEAVIVAKGR